MPAYLAFNLIKVRSFEKPHQGTVAGQPVGATIYPGRHQNLGRWSKLEAKGRPATSCSTHMFLHGGRVFLVPPSLSSAAATAQSPMDDECSKRVMGVAVPRDPVEIWSAPTKVPPERDTNSHGPWATLVQQQQLGSPTWALQIVSSCSPVAWNICKVQHEQCRLTCLCSIIL